MYLTEDRLAEILTTTCPQYDWVRNKTIPNSGYKYRPDFRCEELNVIIEFDGLQHYTSSKVVWNDFDKNQAYSELGYRIFRIPYFVQMTSDLLSSILKAEVDFEQEYPHGFIDKKATLPADFCEAGYYRFLLDLHMYDDFKNEILESLLSKDQNVFTVFNRDLLGSVQGLINETLIIATNQSTGMFGVDVVVKQS